MASASASPSASPRTTWGAHGHSLIRNPHTAWQRMPNHMAVMGSHDGRPATPDPPDCTPTSGCSGMGTGHLFLSLSRRTSPAHRADEGTPRPGVKVRRGFLPALNQLSPPCPQGSCCGHSPGTDESSAERRAAAGPGAPSPRQIHPCWSCPFAKRPSKGAHGSRGTTTFQIPKFLG